MTIPTLETKRLIMREWHDSDITNFAKFKMDKELARFVSSTESVHSSWREMGYYAGHWLLRGYGFWCLQLKSTGESIGYCGPYCPNGWPEPEIGWGVYKEHQHKGYATEAAVASLAFAYDKLGWTTAISLIADENKPSQALATRLGAKPEYPFEMRGTPCTVYRHLNPIEFQQHSKENMKWH
jgi:RimJ/RimL family protein N-acetyltransferase